MEPEKYIARAFEAEAVRITEENIHEVARWCSGEVKGFEGHTYVAWGVAGVNRRLAFPENWIYKYKISGGVQFVAVPEPEFQRYFRLKSEEDSTEAIRSCLRSAFGKVGIPSELDEDLIEETLGKILEKVNADREYWSRVSSVTTVEKKSG